MADRIPLVIEGSQIREITSGDRLSLTGNALQVGGNITPTSDSAYDIGTSSLKFRDIYLSSGTIHLGGVKLKADGGSLTIQDSAGAASGITATSLAQINTDNLTEGSTQVFHTAARARNSMVAGLGITYDSASGVISLPQAITTTSDVTFAKTTLDSAVVDQVSFNTSFADSHIAFEEGAVWYDPYHKNLNYYNDLDVPIEIGMQMVERVYNNTGVTIAKGKPLYYSGNITSTAGVESPTVALANATSATKYNVQGLAAEDIADASYGFIVVAGVIDGFDTSGLSAGQNFFAGLTDGAVQNAAPTYPNYPMCLGWVVKSDANDGRVVINQQNHSVNTFRVQGAAHVGADLQVDGNLTVLGSTTTASSENISIGGAFNYFNAGDTIGAANTSFVGSGLDDADLVGHYKGDSSARGFYVKIDGTGGTDTFEWGNDSGVGAIATGIAITGADQALADGISVNFGATTGHTSGDKWVGSASPVNVDTGWSSNRNTGTSGVGYTHLGMFYDASTTKFRLFDEYYPEPEGSIDTTDSSFNAGTLVAGTFEGNLTGNVTGALSGNATTATTLATGRTISLTGDVTGTSASFDGSGNVSIAATIAANSVALGTDTTGNYVATVTGGTGITSSVETGENAATTISITAGSVGSTQLASASTLTIKNTAGTTLKTVIGAGS